LLALGYPAQEATAAIRMTLGRHTTVEDIDWTAMVFKQVLKRLMSERAIARL